MNDQELNTLLDNINANIIELPAGTRSIVEAVIKEDRRIRAEKQEAVPFHVQSLMRLLSRVSTNNDVTTDDVCAAEASLFAILEACGAENVMEEYQDSHDAGPSLCEICGRLDQSMFGKKQAG
jgi:hypothetical protein